MITICCKCVHFQSKSAVLIPAMQAAAVAFMRQQDIEPLIVIVKFKNDFDCTCVLQHVVISKHLLVHCLKKITPTFFTRDSIYAIARICHGNSVCLSVCLSVRLSVTWVDQSKTVEARITQFSPYSSPIPLVFRG